MHFPRPISLHAVSALLILAGCGGGGSDGGGGGTTTPPTGTPAAVQSVTLSSSTAQLAAGDVSVLTATVSATGTASTAVTWTTSNAGVATVSGGSITGVSAGTATITATSQFDNTKSASAAITVSPAPTPVVSAVSPANLLVSSANQTITVTGTGFQPGLTLTITKPRFATGTLVFGPTALQSLTSTSFQVPVGLTMLGSYTFTVQNASGLKSNTFTAAAQFRTTGATWIPEGVRWTEVNSGFAGGVNNVAALRLTDGRWRIIYNSTQSVISTDGLTWQLESPTRGLAGLTPDGSVARLPRLFQLPNGQWRVYFSCCTASTGGMYSATSADEGVTWTRDAGVRILDSVVGLTFASEFLSGLSVVPTKDGKYRGYFANQLSLLNESAHTFIKSATSTDLLTWTMDPGVRIGPGATLTQDVLHPKAIVNADGSITVFYYRHAAPQGLYASTSADGLSFTQETLLESLGQGGDPDVVRVGSALRLYYNWGDNNGGAIYSAISTSGNPFALSPNRLKTAKQERSRTLQR